MRRRIMPFTGPLEDQIAIRALNDSYADAVFRRDAADWGACWAEDGVWNLMGEDVVGRDAIVGLWVPTMESFSFVAYYPHMGSIEIEGDQARGTVYTHEVLEPKGGAEMRPNGRYHDLYVKRDGRWLFKERRYTMLRGGAA
jgi:uncharacterized protein (TIGR02246 family)